MPETEQKCGGVLKELACEERGEGLNIKVNHMVCKKVGKVLREKKQSRNGDLTAMKISSPALKEQGST